MKIRRAAIAAAIISGLLSFHAGPSAAAEPASPATGLLRLEGDLTQVSEPSRYGYVILNAWEHASIADIKAANPGTKVLVYKNLAACKYSQGRDPSGNRFWSVGVGCPQADSEHPEWYLKDTSNNKVEWCDYGGNWFMDLGAPSYQDAWIQNVRADLQGHGWDGVLVDDTMYSPRYHLCGRTLAKYPSDQTFAAATESFLARVGPALISSGFEVIPNISDAHPTSVWPRWVGHVSGAMKEWWVADRAKVYADGEWAWAQDFMYQTVAQGKPFLAVTYGEMSNTALMRYAAASFLMGWDGRKGALIYHADRNDPWSDAWTTSIGAPTGNRVQLNNGVWRRDFNDGVALVNPSSSRTVTVNLGGTYALPDGGSATEVAMGPRSGLVLKRSEGEETGGETDPISLDLGKRPRPRKVIVKLRWDGGDTAKVVVMRQGKVVAKIQNGGTFKHVVRKRPGRRIYRYVVCAPGGSDCSNPMRVRVRR